MISKADVWIIKRKGKKRTHYAIRWIDPETRRWRCQSVGRDSKLAERKAAIKGDELRRCILRDPMEVTWQQFVTDELAHIKARHSPAYVVIMKTALDTLGATCSPASPLHVSPAMVERYITSRMGGSRRCKARACGFANPIDRTTCHKCEGKLPSTVTNVSAHTVRKNARALHVAFEHARKRYNLPSNPFTDAELPPPKKGVIKRTLTVQEQRLALAACPNMTWRAFLYIGLTAGLRRGDLAAVRWTDVDLDAGLIIITEQKTGVVHRVPLTPTAVAMLRDVRLVHAGPEVFTHRGASGERVDFFRAVGPIMELIAERANIERFTFHATRRTLATDLAAANVNQIVATAVIGHASMATTARYYTAVDDATKRAAQNQLPLERTGT